MKLKKRTRQILKNEIHRFGAEAWRGTLLFWVMFSALLSPGEKSLPGGLTIDKVSILGYQESSAPTVIVLSSFFEHLSTKESLADLCRRLHIRVDWPKLQRDQKAKESREYVYIHRFTSRIRSLVTIFPVAPLYSAKGPSLKQHGDGQNRSSQSLDHS